MSLFTTYWTELMRSLFPWAATFFKAASFLGSEYFLVAVIAIGYWGYDRRLSKQTAILLLITAVSNYWLKITIQNPRPPSTLWLPGVTAKNYSLPSGHAQSSTVIWGWLGLKTSKKWVRGFLASLILAIGLSRVYLGVHWLGDVLFGWVIGAVIIWVINRYETTIFAFVESDGFDVGLTVFGFVSMLGVEYYSPVVLGDNFGSLGGLMMGVGIGFLLEKKFVKYEPDDASLWRRVLRVILGLGLVLSVLIGLSGLLPSEVCLLRCIRYALVAITALFVWPYIFTRYKL